MGDLLLRRIVAPNAARRRGCYAPVVVTIELFGVPRLRAGREAVAVEARSLGEALAALGRACPALHPSVVDGERLSPFYLVAVNGVQFTGDAAHPLEDGDVLILLAADAGG
jgi:molybdopterin converting factor small subunit